VGAFPGEELSEIEDHGEGSEGLAAFHVEVPRDEGGCQAVRGGGGERHAAVLEDGLEMAEILPAQVSGDGSADVIHRLDVGVGEHGFDLRRAGLHHDAQVLATHDVDGMDKIFGGDGIVERGEEQQEGATPESDAEERGEFVEVRGDGADLEIDELFAATVEVGGAVVGADEGPHGRVEGDESEQIPLTFGGGPQEQGGLVEMLDLGFGREGGLLGISGCGGRGERAAGEA
jgi:hypothetical protein